MWILMIRDPGSAAEPEIKLAEKLDPLQRHLRRRLSLAIEEVLLDEGDDAGLKILRAQLDRLTSKDLAAALRDRFGLQILLREQEPLLR